MGEKKKHRGQPKDLRVQAEEHLDMSSADLAALSGGQVEKLFYELQVHQIELKMQNDELQRTQLELEISRDRYLDLYDFAPIGYFSLDLNGTILEANLTASKLLGVPRQNLIGKKLSPFVHRSDQDALHLHRQQVFAAGERQTCEIRMKKSGDVPLHVRLESLPIEDEDRIFCRCRTVMIDITEREHTRKQLGEFNRHLKLAEEKERQKISRELHDEFGQLLTALRMDLGWLNKELNQRETINKVQFSEKISTMGLTLQQAVESVRRVATLLRPATLDRLGILPALEELARNFQKRTGIACNLLVGSDIHDRVIDDERGTAFFRIAQEFLTNVMRHAHASEVGITVGLEKGQIILELTDNGVGISNDWIHPSNYSLGILGMQERAKMLKGTLTVRGTPGNGTYLKVGLPS